MTLTWPVALAVLCGAALHAGWNALVKSAGDKTVDTALVHFLGALVALPFALWVGLPRPEAWPFIAASLFIHIGYYIALAGAYRHGELGLTYPIMRGFAPLLVALGSATVIGEAPSAAAWAGIIGITLGVALVGLARQGPQAPGLRQAADSPQGLSASGLSPGQALHHGKALAFAFANAAIIAVYTVVDGLGVRTEVEVGGEVMRYVLWLFVFDGFPYPLLVMWRRGPQGRRDIWAYARQRWPLAAIGGTASIGSYAIALWAMTRAPVASVAALRETSVLFATVLGTWMLKEAFGWQRAIGTVVIVGGVMALRLA